MYTSTAIASKDWSLVELLNALELLRCNSCNIIVGARISDNFMDMMSIGYPPIHICAPCVSHTYLTKLLTRNMNLFYLLKGPNTLLETGNGPRTSHLPFPELLASNNAKGVTNGLHSGLHRQKTDPNQLLHASTIKSGAMRIQTSLVISTVSTA